MSQNSRLARPGLNHEEAHMRLLGQGSLLLGVCILLLAGSRAQANEEAAPPSGWTTRSPRDEIRPAFAYEPKGGPGANGSFVIVAGQDEGLFGWWEKTFPVAGGQHYKFFAWRKSAGLEVTRRTAVVRILWQDGEGRRVLRDKPSFASYRPGERPRSEPDFPPDAGTGKHGWTEVSAVYQAPADATRAVVELSYRWEANGRVEWSDVSLQKTEALAPRNVRLATVHYRPRDGKTATENANCSRR